MLWTQLRLLLLHLIHKGFAVGTFLLGGVHLMCAYLDAVQGAVVHCVRMVHTVFDGTLDTLVFAIYFHVCPP